MQPSEPEPRPEALRLPPIEPLAVASLASAIVLGPCCIGTFAGIILGLMGLHRIRKANGALRGAGLARAGVLVGAGLLVIEVMLMTQLGQYMHNRVETQVQSAVTSVLTKENLPPSFWVQPNAGGPTEAEVTAWRQKIVAPLGELRNLRITHREQSTWPRLRVTVAFTADFEAGTVQGGAYFIQSQPGGFDIALLMQRLELDVQGTRSSIPPAPASEAAPVTPAAPPN